jgi:hypothetical protein
MEDITVVEGLVTVLRLTSVKAQYRQTTVKDYLNDSQWVTTQEITSGIAKTSK